MIEPNEPHKFIQLTEKGIKSGYEYIHKAANGFVLDENELNYCRLFLAMIDKNYNLIILKMLESGDITNVKSFLRGVQYVKNQ